MKFLKGVLREVIASLIVSLLGMFLVGSTGWGSVEVRPLEINIGWTIIGSGPKSTETPEPPGYEPQASNALECTDASGQKGVFRAMVFLDSYNWVRGSSELVEFNGEVIPYFLTVLRQEPVQKLLASAQEIVAVGTASCESPWGSLVENRRAEQRAKQLVRWIEESRNQLPQHPNTPMRSVRPLSLGGFIGGCSAPEAASTARQRRIILIGVAERQKGLDLASCLQRRMQEDDSLKFLIDNYSRFD